LVTLDFFPAAIHLWHTRVWDIPDQDLASFPDLLTPDELSRLERYRFAESRRHYLVTRVLVRTVLSRYHSWPPAAWHFRENRFGKPELDPPPGCPALRFNLSHTDGLAVCAVALDRVIGVDVENLNHKPSLDIAHRFFAPSEADYLNGLPEERRTAAFFALWTLKEAYIKARGDSLSLPLDRFIFKLDPITVTFAPDMNDDSSRWRFFHLRPTVDHLMALAVHCQPGESLEVISRELIRLVDEGRA